MNATLEDQDGVAEYFKCRVRSCVARDMWIRNCGTNRYNCFLCDYDMCLDCNLGRVGFRMPKVVE